MLISVIIPVYNTERYLKDCLDSLVAQSFKDWEAICVDDGSTDGCPAILDDYAEKDLRFRVIHKKNEGLSVVRNVAMRETRGDWVGFLDSDDYVEVDWLQKVADSLRVRQVDLVRCGFKWLFEDRAGRIVARKKNIELTLPDSDAVMKWGWTTWLRETMVCMCFYRREMLLSSGLTFETGVPLEDMVFNLNLLPHITSMSQIASDGYVYRQRAGSLLHSGRRTFIATERILSAGLQIYQNQRMRLAELGLIPVAFRQVLMIVWGNTGTWTFEHPKGEEGLKGDVRRLAYRVLEPCVNDRYSGRPKVVRYAIMRIMAFLAGSMMAHYFYRRAFRFAWNMRDMVRRMKNGL